MTQPILEVKNICKYFGGLHAVENVSMQVKEGEVFGIIGPNGAGKTTFFNLCAGVFPVTKGAIYFKGEEITGTRPENIARKGIARTFQNIKLFNYMSVINNVKIGCHINMKTSAFDAIFHTKTYTQDESYAQQHAADILEELGLLAYADEMAGNLAYGTQRKVEIARALATNPSLLLLDEPAAGMNPNETMELLQFIKQIQGSGKTVIVIEHDVRFVMNLCDRIMVLNYGEKICEGLPQEVRNNKQVQEAYFGKGIANTVTEGAVC